MKLNKELKNLYVKYLSEMNPKYADYYKEYSDNGIIYLISQNYVGGIVQLKKDMKGLYEQTN